MPKLPNLKLASLLVFSILASAFVLHPGSAHAATIAVATGTDETTNNSNCSLSEAIININDQAATYTECTNLGDGYGTNDTINIPAGTITLAGTLTNVARSVTINGAGMDRTIIDGAAQYTTLNAYVGAPSDVSVSSLTVKRFKGNGISSGGPLNLRLSRVEVDGTGSVGDGGNSSGISFVSANGDNSFRLDNGYIHDLVMTDSQAIGVISVTGDNTTISTQVTNTTISNIGSESGQAIGLLQASGYASQGAPAPTEDENMLSNVTITRVHSDTSSAGGYVISGYVVGGTTTVNSYLNNTTITDIAGVVNSQAGLNSTALAVATGAYGPDDHFNASIYAKNVLITTSTSVGAPNSCTIYDISGGFGGTGTSNGVITSTGGNITDDTTCSPYFTQSSDMNNITNLKDYLGPLGSNGGSVPTIPLLLGSPAIDNGITVAEVSADARGVARPQGSAYDSGAYEYVPVASLASTGESITTMLLAVTALLGLAGVAQLLRVNMLQ